MNSKTPSGSDGFWRQLLTKASTIDTVNATATTVLPLSCQAVGGEPEGTECVLRDENQVVVEPSF